MGRRSLTTFLGNNRYEPTCYVLDATPPRHFTTRFVGLGLAEALDVQTLRVLGTSGSMWYELPDALGITNSDELGVTLLEAVEQNRVDAPLLARLEHALNERSQGKRRFELRLIPYGFGEAEQVKVLQVMAEGHDTQNAADEHHLDITHALRHLPMLGMLSSFYLQSLGKAAVQEIYYGAYQKGVAQTPVVRLTGLLEIQNWVRCMDQFDKDGDYSVFVPLLKKDQVQGHQLLGEAAFLERVGNLSLAKQKLGSFWDKQPHAHSPAGQMFLPLLKERLNWRLTLRRSAWEQTLATQALNRKDYLRACIMAYEARLSHQVEQTGGDINNFTHRDQASKTLENASDGRNHKAPDNFFTLKNLRNQLAHGVRAHSAASSLRAQESTNFIAAMACDETKLHTWLSQVLKQTL